MKALALVVLASCGPSLTGLTSNRHYREALCAADDGSTDDRVHVERALARDAEVRLHVALVGETELAKVVGSHAGDLSRRLRLARIQLTTNTLPVDEISASVDLIVDGRSLTKQIDLPLLADATGETLPARRTDRTYITGGNVMRGLGAFFTFGFSLPFTRFRQETIEVDAPHHEYVRMAPLATALRDATTREGCRKREGWGHGRGTGLACTWYVALDPTAGDGDVQLTVDVEYRAWRDDRLERCQVAQHRTIKLGRMRALDDRVAHTFGPRMRAVSELAFD